METLKNMFKEAEARGLASKDVMWRSVEAIDEMLDIMREEHPSEYKDIMRCQHEIIFGPHYNEEYAKCDIEHISYIGKDGAKHTGGHWTKEQVVSATQGLNFPQGTTDCDKWVALNAMYADLCLELDEQKIISCAHRFYFKDEDAPDGKIWVYMNAMR